jgi:DNA polymerase I
MTETRKLAISQVEYSSIPGCPVIHIFGRDANGVPDRIDVTGFRPYFYIGEKDTEKSVLPGVAEVDKDTVYHSIRGELLRKAYVKSPKDVRDNREYYNHFEADIPFTNRLMIDLGLTGGIEIPIGVSVIDYHELKPATVDTPARTCIIDIECEDERGFPDPKHDAIFCITCYDSFDEKYTTFLLGEMGEIEKIQKSGGLKNGCFNPEVHYVLRFDSETVLLQSFAHYIREKDQDVLTGWNFILFDMPYIIGRMEHFSINPSILARITGYAAYGGIRGRSLFDLLEAYKKMRQQQKPSYRLDAIAFEEVGDQKVRYTGTISNLWKTDPAKMVEYNFKDVELCVAIEKKDQIVEFYREIARYVGMPLDKTLNSSAVVDNFLLHKARGKFVLPSKRKVAGEDFEGATVFPPVKGRHSNIVVLDLKSLYPMAMMTINASPETKNPKGELVAPNGIRFLKHPDGLVRTVVMELLAERDKKKALRNTFPFGSREYKMYDMQQNVLKIIMNTYYGVSGYPGFRLYDRDVGSAVTSVGRAIIEFSRKIIEAEGYQVILGDTDSCAVKLPDTFTREETIAEAKRLESILNAKYKEFAKVTLNADVHYFSTKFEKLYERFFSGGRKKRYAGLLTWKEGKDVREFDIVGFEAKRSDTPELTREVQKKLLTMILEGDEYPTIKEYLSGVVGNYLKGKYPLDMIGIPGGFGKAFEDYDGDDAHLRGAKYANDYLHTSFGKGSKPKRVYIKSVNGVYPNTDVVCFEYGDQIPKNFVVDWDIMMEKTIEKPISRITESLGWSWNDFDPTRTTLAQWGLQ